MRIFKDTTTYSMIFKLAHEMARNNLKACGGDYKIAFKWALTTVYRAFHRTIFVNNLEQMGAHVWIKKTVRGELQRVYFNNRTFIGNFLKDAGIEMEFYGSGNIRECTVGGKKIANGRAARILNALNDCYYDCCDFSFHGTGKELLEAYEKQGRLTYKDFY